MAGIIEGPGMLGSARAAAPAATQEQILAAVAKLKAQGIPASRAAIAELIATDPTLGAKPAPAPVAAPAGVGGPSSEIARRLSGDAELEARRAAEAAAMKARQQEFLRARAGRVTR